MGSRCAWRRVQVECIEMVGQWFLGDSSDPLIAGLTGDCGQLIDGIFFMAAPIDRDVRFECDVPTGTPIVLSHSGFFATEGIDGDTDQELVAAASAGYVTLSSSLSQDGEAIPTAARHRRVRRDL